MALLDGRPPNDRIENIASIKAHTAILDLDPFGSVSGGTLKITTLMKSYDVGTDTWDKRCRTLEKEAQSFEIFLDDKSSQIHSRVVFALLLSGYKAGELALAFFYENPNRIPSTDSGYSSPTARM